MDSLSFLLLFNGINLIIVSYRFRPETPMFYDFHRGKSGIQIACFS